MLFFDIFENLPGSPSFVTFYLRDVNPLGGTTKHRRCQRPNEAMRVVHARLIKYLKSRRVQMPFATAFKKGDSPKKNVTKHRKNRFFYLLDIHRAFPSVDGQHLAVVLCGLDGELADREEEVLEHLKVYCLDDLGGLVIGAPASPSLFNLYAHFLIDRSMAELCKRYQLIYTRYSDDLTFSSKMPIGERKRKAIRAIIESAGFQVSHRKSGVYDLAKGPITINGVGLELGGRMFLPRHYLRKIRGAIHLADQGKVRLKVLNGYMGVFWAVTKGRSLNRTEQKLVTEYKKTA